MHVDASTMSHTTLRALRQADSLPLDKLCKQVQRENYREWKRWDQSRDWHQVLQTQYGLFGLAPEAPASYTDLPLFQERTPMFTLGLVDGMMFNLGQCVTTPGALEAFTTQEADMLEYLCRHGLCDWGECGEEDAQSNNEALHNGARVFSAYLLPDDTKIWIITEADRSSTCVLLPNEY